MSLVIEPLTGQQRETLLAILASFAERIDSVAIFGSRARRTHRPGSDIDLLVYGDLDFDAMAQIAAALDDSDLSVAVDLHLFGDPGDKALAAVATRDAETLFTRAELLAAAQ